jgi:hypothetical protein
MRIGRENTKFQCKANHKSFVFPTDKNLPMASPRTNLNTVPGALFVAAMKKEKNKKKTTAPADDSSEDKAFEGIVRYIARDHLPKRNNNLLPHQKKNTEMQRAVFAALSTILTRKTASLISKFGSINDSLSVSFTLLGSCSIILASFSSGQ